MLVLSRKIGEKIMIGDDVEVTINRISGHRVSVGITAPSDMRIARGELRLLDGTRDKVGRSGFSDPVRMSVAAGSEPHRTTSR